MEKDLTEWLRSGEYLPEVLRDFHDQKDTFKTIHGTVNVEANPYAKDVGWVAGQCYVIDIFLWWMAKHGYTLQKSRAKVLFEDLDEARQAGMEKWRDECAASLGYMLKSPIEERSDTDGAEEPESA